jgi:hypothetical protein
MSVHATGTSYPAGKIMSNIMSGMKLRCKNRVFMEPVDTGMYAEMGT